MFTFKPRFYKFGILFFKNTLPLNKNKSFENIGLKINKNDVTIKVISENCFLFYSSTKSIVERILTRKLLPNVISGKCEIVNQYAIVKYKMPVFLLTSFVTGVIFSIYHFGSFLSPAMIFLISITALFLFLQYLKFGSIKIDIEEYIRNGK
jgi:hypothetical protein